MKHADHVALVRDGVEGAGTIVALDLDRRALAELAARVSDRFPDTTLRTVTADLRAGIPAGPFDGVLAANSLHYVEDLVPVLRSIHGSLAGGGRLVLVEYDADRGNRWVPHPISFARFAAIAPEAGFGRPALIERVPSRFLGAMYGAVATRNPVSDSTGGPPEVAAGTPPRARLPASRR